MPKTLEHCFYCDGLTGKAGIGDDSIYCDICQEGPLCDSCWEEILDAVICCRCQNALTLTEIKMSLGFIEKEKDHASESL